MINGQQSKKASLGAAQGIDDKNTMQQTIAEHFPGYYRRPRKRKLPPRPPSESDEEDEVDNKPAEGAPKQPRRSQRSRKLTEKQVEAMELDAFIPEAVKGGKSSVSRSPSPTGAKRRAKPGRRARFPNAGQGPMSVLPTQPPPQIRPITGPFRSAALAAPQLGLQHVGIPIQPASQATGTAGPKLPLRSALKPSNPTPLQSIPAPISTIKEAVKLPLTMPTLAPQDVAAFAQFEQELVVSTQRRLLVQHLVASIPKNWQAVPPAVGSPPDAVWQKIQFTTSWLLRTDPLLAQLYTAQVFMLVSNRNRHLISKPFAHAVLNQLKTQAQHSVKVPMR